MVVKTELRDRKMDEALVRLARAIRASERFGHDQKRQAARRSQFTTPVGTTQR